MNINIYVTGTGKKPNLFLTGEKVLRALNFLAVIIPNKLGYKIIEDEGKKKTFSPPQSYELPLNSTSCYHGHPHKNRSKDQHNDDTQS